MCGVEVEVVSGSFTQRVLGVDVVVDPIGGELADAALRASGWMSTYVVIGFAAGSIPKLPANLVLLNNRTVVGVDWGAWTGRDPAGQGAMLDELMTAVADGRLLDRGLVGKTVLVP